MVTVQNVTFFPKKNMILISRGLNKVWVSHTQGGVLVVKLKGYDRYWFCPDTGNVFSRKSSKIYEVLKRNEEELKAYYWLHLHGVRTKVYLWEILRDNMKGIETFIFDRQNEGNVLKLVS